MTESAGCAAGILPTVLPDLTIYTQGCVQKVLHDLPLDEIKWAVAIIVAVELLGIIFGCCLAARFKHAVYRSRA